MRILSIAFISSITTAISFGAKIFVFGGVEKVEHVVVVVDTKLAMEWKRCVVSHSISL
jgi:hypothetical protein